MGSNFNSWDDYIAAIGAEGGTTGAYYTGAGGGEMLWLIVSIVFCVIALVLGARHELGAYRKMETRRK